MLQILRRQILNQILEVRSVDSAYLRDVEIAYLRFPIPELETPATIFLELDGQTLSGSLLAQNKKFVQPLLAEALRSWQAKTLANRLLLAEIRRNFDVLHGCAVESAAGAILFIGGSGSGKSTLALELGKAGYPLLCEGQIPIERETSLIKPFPRGFEVHGEKLGQASTPGYRSAEKRLMPAPANYSNKDGSLQAIVFLQDLFPGLSRQRIELGCFPEDTECFVKFLNDHEGYEMVAETLDGRTLITCRFDPGTDRSLDELSRALSESDLNPMFLSFVPADSPNWRRPLVAIQISSPMATLGMLANTSQAARSSGCRKEDSERLARFSHYAGQAQAYNLFNGSLSERTRWIMDHFPATGTINC